MTDFFETRVENLEHKQEKKNLQQLPRNQRKNLSRIGNEKFSTPSNVVESNEESSVKHKPVRKYCVLHEKRSQSSYKCEDRRTMVNKHKHKKREISNPKNKSRSKMH